MQRNFLEIFKGKLNTHRIQTKVLALEAGRNASYLSEVFTGKKSPTLETFTSLVEAADRLSPGFADEYYLALAGNIDVSRLVNALSYDDLCLFMICAGQKFSRSSTSNDRQPIAA